MTAPTHSANQNFELDQLDGLSGFAVYDAIGVRSGHITDCVVDHARKPVAIAVSMPQWNGRRQLLIPFSQVRKIDSNICKVYLRLTRAQARDSYPTADQIVNLERVLDRPHDAVPPGLPSMDLVSARRGASSRRLMLAS